jgi:hypothetical protein
MILYRNPRTHELFTEDELRGLFDEQILAMNLEEDEEYPTFEEWIHEAVSWGMYLIEENADAR